MSRSRNTYTLRGGGPLNFIKKSLGGPLATSIKNRLPKGDSTWRPQHEGELHIPQILPNKKIGFSNFTGQHLGLSQVVNDLASYTF